MFLAQINTKINLKIHLVVRQILKQIRWTLKSQVDIELKQGRNKKILGKQWLIGHDIWLGT